MIADTYYHTIYLFIVTIISLFYYNRYRSSSQHVLIEKNAQFIILVIFLSIFIGLRPSGSLLFGDTFGYAHYYHTNFGLPFKFDWSTSNLLFDNLLLFLASIECDFSVFLLICAFVYFVARYYATSSLFPQNKGMAYVVFLGAFISYTSAINGFKAGAAASLFCCAIAFRNQIRTKWRLVILFMALSYSFHHSMHVCIIAYIICLLVKNTKIYYIFWILCLICAISHVTYFQTFFAGWTDEAGSRYLLSDETEGWHTGLRYDFILYGAMPVLLGWYIKFKKKIEVVGFDFVLNLYLLLNGVWMLCMYASFTNRIAALSWFIYPIVICYPFLHDNQPYAYHNNKRMAIIMMLNLGFTLFMNIIYY